MDSYTQVLIFIFNLKIWQQFVHNKLIKLTRFVGLADICTDDTHHSKTTFFGSEGLKSDITATIFFYSSHTFLYSTHVWEHTKLRKSVPRILWTCSENRDNRSNRITNRRWEATVGYARMSYIGWLDPLVVHRNNMTNKFVTSAASLKTTNISPNLWVGLTGTKIEPTPSLSATEIKQLTKFYDN